jgi:hypothetical protein
MNIFILDYNMEKNVQSYIDVHVRKMLVEYTQILSTVCRLNGLNCGYKATHVNHPCVRWCNESLSNWLWLDDLVNLLLREYYHRFNKIHKTYITLYNFYSIPYSSDKGLTPHSLVMPDKYKTDDVVESYRNYYRNEKRTDKNGKNMAIWTNRDVPEWFYEEEK